MSENAGSRQWGSLAMSEKHAVKALVRCEGTPHCESLVRPGRVCRDCKRAGRGLELQPRRHLRRPVPPDAA